MYYYGGFFVGAFLVGLLLSYLGFGIVGKIAKIPQNKGLRIGVAFLIAVIWTVKELNG